MNIQLVIIDPQNDFCQDTGNLFVKGADKDMDRLAVMINNNINKFADIHITFDSHHYVDIAHPVFWRDKDGNEPSPFTIITHQDVLNKVWRPKHEVFNDYVKVYTSELERKGNYSLCILPYHCIIGTPGHNLYPAIADAVKNWSISNFGIVNMVTKGSNFKTEHYGAVEAEVPDPNDVTTQLNTPFIKMLQEADVILLAGEARSHCLANTVKQIANNFSDEEIKKLVLLEDATSDVTGFEQLGVDFVNTMKKRGMQISNTVDFFKGVNHANS